MVRPAPSFKGFSPASPTTSRIAKASSAKRDTKPERLLRCALRKAGLAYKVDVGALPGRPDVVVPAARIAVFCDGDFWHGRDLRKRVRRLAGGHNAPYWVEKLKANVRRDRKTDRALRKSGWKVLRFWESDVIANPDKAAEMVVTAARSRRPL